MNTKSLSRKNFLLGAATAGGALVMARCGPAEQGPDDFSDLEIAASGQELSRDGGFDAGVPTPQCEETEDNILGPFYKENAPFRTTLANPSEGIPITITGTVSAAGVACLPLNRVLLDVWQANASGDYDLNPSTLRWRGRFYSDAQGGFRFNTIAPGRYLNGSQFRPRHIHLKASLAGYVPLTTQIYFKGDRYLAADPFAKASLVIPLTPSGNGYVGTFNVVLAQK